MVTATDEGDAAAAMTALPQTAACPGRRRIYEVIRAAGYSAGIGLRLQGGT